MDFAQARLNMIEGQIRTNRVTDQFVLDALDELPREAFVPDALKSLSYVDEDIQVGAGRILMEPMVMARLMQAAAIEETDLALVIAAATGYEAAAIAKIASAVIAVESDVAMAHTATEHLAEQGADTVTVVQDDLTVGNADHGPYDVIFINGAVDAVSAAILDQLSDGGRLVCVKTAKGMDKAVLITKTDGVVSETELFDANIPALAEFKAETTFTF